MTVRLEPKRATEVRNYKHDWSAFLGEDTISSQTTTSDDVTISSALPTDANTAVQWKVAGGVDGSTALITQTILTVGGLTETEVFSLVISAGEPVSLGEAKDYLRVLTDQHDARIEAMIPRARAWVEDYTGLALVQRQFTELRRTERNAIRLFKAPLKTVGGVTYGDAQTYTPRVLNGVLVAASDASWPVLDQFDAFEITYTAGFDEGKVPDVLIGAVLALVEGEFDTGAAYPDDAVKKAENCCGMQRRVTV